MMFIALVVQRINAGKLMISSTFWPMLEEANVQVLGKRRGWAVAIAWNEPSTILGHRVFPINSLLASLSTSGGEYVWSV